MFFIYLFIYNYFYIKSFKLIKYKYIINLISLINLKNKFLFLFNLYLIYTRISIFNLKT